ncbi:MAG: GNAT family N-acetyltransferase [Roseburia sp.]|nr:GNAT family N-acetyltransferase [Roseburia sp.]
MKDSRERKCFETERLFIRPLRESDAEEMYNNFWGSDIVYRYLPWEKCESAKDAREKIKVLIRNASIPNRYYWGVEYKPIGEVVGMVWFVDYDKEKKNIMAGYCLGEKFWKQGIMTETLTITSEYLLESMDNITKICATHDLANPASGRILEKSGYKKVRQGMHYSLSLNKEVMTGFYELTKE